MGGCQDGHDRLGYHREDWNRRRKGASMASSSTQKLKVLHLMDILRTETDPDHGLTMPQIVERLAARGIDAERKDNVCEPRPGLPP